jgi:tRNA 2-thiouridine synthesizing protein A
MQTESHTIVDSRGSSCPGPVTDLARAYRRAKVGDTLEVWATDPGFAPDVRAWAAKTQNEIVSLQQQSDKIVAVIRVVHR